MDFVSRKTRLVTKILAYILYTVCMVLGVVLVLTCISLLKRPPSYHLIPQYNLSFITSVISIGGFVSIITACFGLYGLYRLKQGTILLHGILLTILTCYLLAAAITCLGYYNEVQPVAAEKFYQALKLKYGKLSYGNYTSDVNRMQSHLGCCGAYGYTDYNKMKWNVESEMEFVPFSCCRKKYVNCNNYGIHKNAPEKKGLIYTRGCATALRKWASYYFQIAGYICIALCIVQLIAACLTYIIHECFDDFYWYGKKETMESQSKPRISMDE